MTDKRLEEMLKAALTPDIDDNEIIVDLNGRKERNIIMMKGKVKIAAIIVACMTLVIGTTVFARSKIKYLESHSYNGEFTEYSDLKKAEKKAGYGADVVESFSNGYRFEEASVADTDAVDEDGNRVLSFKELHVFYKNADGNRISLGTTNMADYNNPDDIEPEPDEIRNISGIQVSRTVYRYLINAPEDYELTEEEKIFDEAGKLNMAYDGGAEIERYDYAVVSWVKDGIKYGLYDFHTNESADSVFSMAEELITR